MNKAKAIPEEILSSIQKLPQDSLDELANFIEYLQYKNSLKILSASEYQRLTSPPLNSQLQ